MIFAPLPLVFGHDRVQANPQRGQFPLLGIEKKREVILDDWRFTETALSMSSQLLWFEGKPLPVAQPQGKEEYKGHLLYRGTAPIFITTPLQRLEEMELAVAMAELEGKSSECSMLLRRLRVYRFRKRIAKPPQQLPACAHCFVGFVFEAEARWMSQNSAPENL